jgi:four helix bundle protein
MFDALEVMLQVLEALAPIEARVRKRSLELARQMSRAAESVALNLAEGRGRRDGDQRRHYEMANGSAAELTVALRIVIARQIVTRDELAPVDALLDRVRAMLWKLTH